MQWYYRLRLRRIHAEIEKLTKATGSRLQDNYTDHLRLRSLTILAERLQERLARAPAPPSESESAGS